MEERTIADILLERLRVLNEEYDDIFEEIRLLVKDKNISLETRWKLFEEFDNGKEYCWIPHFPIIMEIDPKDVVYWDRRKSFTIFEFIEYLEDNLYEENNIIEKAYMLFKEDREPTTEELEYVIKNNFMPEFKEWVLDNFLYEFTMDW